MLVPLTTIHGIRVHALVEKMPHKAAGVVTQQNRCSTVLAYGPIIRIQEHERDILQFNRKVTVPPSLVNPQDDCIKDRPIRPDGQPLWSRPTIEDGHEDHWPFKVVPADDSSRDSLSACALGRPQS
jgi:hypothetical protein